MAEHPIQSSRLDLKPGDHIRHIYRLEYILGAGGFGEVWRATQLHDGEALRAVAIKLFSSRGHMSAGQSPRPGGSDDRSGWLHEARTVMQLGAIASVPHTYDVGVDAAHNVAFIAMELLVGEVLEARLARGPIPWRRALQIASAITEALVACHARGISHCDLKPQNVFLCESGRVVVLDFGIASLRGIRTAANAAAEATDLSQTTPVDNAEVDGLTIARIEGVGGTLGYIAPEQLESRPPDPGADVYALGIVLYRMIAGRLPYRVDYDLDRPAADLRLDLNTATIHGDLVPLEDIAPRTPAAVANLVAHMLLRVPLRLPADELCAELAAAQQRPYGIPERPYVDLDTFGPTRAGWLPGRDGDIERIVERLRARRVVVLIGAAGSGKSSLAQAGVAPRVDEQLIANTDGWESIVVRPIAGPQFLRLATEEGSLPTSRIGWIVILDQLEEILALDEPAQDQFCAAVRALVATDPAQRQAIVARGQWIGPDDPVRVVATVRDADFPRVAGLSGLGSLPEQQNLITVTGVDPEAAWAIVVDPVRAVGVDLEHPETVVSEVAALLRRSRGSLPLIQLALSLWWDRDAATGRLTAASWGAIGGVRGALQTAADQLHRELEDDGRAHMRTILVELFRADRTRQSIRRAQLPAGAEDVLDEMHERGLVRWRKGIDGPELEAVHEALCGWPELDRWLSEAQEEKELIEDAQRYTARWRALGEPRPVPETLAWSPGRLERARRLGELLKDARPFIDAGWALVDEHRTRLTKQQAAQQRRQIALILAVGVVVVLLVALAYATRTARQDAWAADAERAKLEQQLEEATVDLGVANARITLALDERRAADARAHDASTRIDAIRREHAREASRLAIELQRKVQRILQTRPAAAASAAPTDAPEPFYVPDVTRIPDRPY